MKIRKEHNHLLCIDSDGCAVNTMTVKHERFFGPYIVDVWGLGDNADKILKHWNTINLYSLSRGINRFKGLLMMLELIIKKGLSSQPLPDISRYRQWVNDAEALSNQTLEEAVKQDDDVCMKMAHIWSMKVNESVAGFENDELSFDNVKETLAKASETADIIVVSSANREAIINEWQEAGIAEYVKFFAGQEMGTKAECINMAMQSGYDKEMVMMIGDSPGDRHSANECSVKFYPILPGREEDSWKHLGDEVLEQFTTGQYSHHIQVILEQMFFEVLGGDD